MGKFLERLRHWLTKSKGCRCCCITCPYYIDCKEDWEGYKMA